VRLCPCFFEIPQRPGASFRDIAPSHPSAFFLFHDSLMDFVNGTHGRVAGTAAIRYLSSEHRAWGVPCSNGGVGFTDLDARFVDFPRCGSPSESILCSLLAARKDLK
jgi:hypothetical protein